MKDDVAISGYSYSGAEHSCAHTHLLPTMRTELTQLREESLTSRYHLFDLGYGNGGMAPALSNEGWKVTEVDPPTEGITQARQAHPELQLDVGSAYDDLATKYGLFPVVASLEVVEHVAAPAEDGFGVADDHCAEIIDPFFGIDLRPLVPMIAPLEIKIVGFEVTLRLARARQPAHQGDLERDDNLRRDLVLDRENVLEISIEPL